jgi:hypothetical protein
VEDRIYDIVPQRLQNGDGVFGQVPDVRKDVSVDVAHGKAERDPADYCPRASWKPRFKRLTVRIAPRRITARAKWRHYTRSWRVDPAAFSNRHSAAVPYVIPTRGKQVNSIYCVANR